MKITSCAFVGPRPSRFSFGYDEECCECVAFKKVLKKEIEQLVKKGVETFYSALNVGVEQWCIEIVLELKKKYPTIKAIGVLPCLGQTASWRPQEKQRYETIIDQLDKKIMVNIVYTTGCIRECNQWIVNNSDIILEVKDKEISHEKAYLLERARIKRVPVIQIYPDTLKVIGA